MPGVEVHGVDRCRSARCTAVRGTHPDRTGRRVDRSSPGRLDARYRATRTSSTCPYPTAAPPIRRASCAPRGASPSIGVRPHRARAGRGGLPGAAVRAGFSAGVSTGESASSRSSPRSLRHPLVGVVDDDCQVVRVRHDLQGNTSRSSTAPAYAIAVVCIRGLLITHRAFVLEPQRLTAAGCLARLA